VTRNDERVTFHIKGPDPRDRVLALAAGADLEALRQAPRVLGAGLDVIASS
jgi:hypothetical protein